MTDASFARRAAILLLEMPERPAFRLLVRPDEVAKAVSMIESGELSHTAAKMALGLLYHTRKARLISYLKGQR